MLLGIRNRVRSAKEAAPPTYCRGEAPCKLTAFHEALGQALKADAHRTKQNRRTAKALFEQIKGDGYEGDYSRVTDFIRAWRGREGKAPHAFVPLKFGLGEAFQFDWSEEGLVVGGIYRRMQVSHLKLYASRAFWLVAYPSQGHEMLFDAHTRSFAVPPCPENVKPPQSKSLPKPPHLPATAGDGSPTKIAEVGKDSGACRSRDVSTCRHLKRRAEPPPLT